jgi:hypothetical protein
MKASPQTQEGVQATLQQWKDAYSQRDLDGALAVMAPTRTWSVSVPARTSGVSGQNS